MTEIHTSLPTNTTKSTSGIKRGTSYPYFQARHTQNPHNPNLSRFELFLRAQTFCRKPEPLFSHNFSNCFGTYQEGSIKKQDNQILNL